MKALIALAICVLSLVGAHAQTSRLPTGAPSWVLLGSNPPTIDLDFQNGRYYRLNRSASGNVANLISTTRASTAYADNAAGVWSSFGSGVARITNKGLLVEEARTNSIRNNSMQGAVAGSPGTLPANWAVGSPTGLTRTISLGAQGGIDYIEFNFSGTTTSSAQIIIYYDGSAFTTAASASQDWTSSIFGLVSSTTGVTAHGTQISFSPSGTANGPNLSTSGFLRSSITGTAPGSTTNVRSQFFTNSISNGTVVNLTVRIGWPQLELGASVSSPIRTTSAAVTRAADVVTVTSPPSFGAASTIFAKATPHTPTNYTSNQVPLAVSDGTANNLVLFLRSSASGNLAASRAVAGSLNTIATLLSPQAQSVSVRMALAGTASDQGATSNGAIPVGTNTLTWPSGMTRIGIGDRGDGSQQWNGYIERVAVWPSTRLSNDALQRVTQ